MPTTITRNAERRRYEIDLDGALAGFADFDERQDGTVVLPHTVIQPDLRDRGLAAELVRAALDDLRSRGCRVVPACWYVARFIESNPDYADMLAAP